MSDMSDIEGERRKRSSRTGASTRKDDRAARHGKSKPGGVIASCGCRYTRTGGYWYMVTPCSGHELMQWPVSDEHMIGAAA
jgi:hypothetical protein